MGIIIVFKLLQIPIGTPQIGGNEYTGPGGEYENWQFSTDVASETLRNRLHNLQSVEPGFLRLHHLILEIF